MKSVTTVAVYETSQFVEGAAGRLDDGQLATLRRYLAETPLAGEPLADWPGCLELAWADSRLVYMIGEAQERIILLTVRAASAKLEPTAWYRRRGREVLKRLRDLGIGLLARDVWTLLKDAVLS